MDKLYPRLFVGDWMDAENLKRSNPEKVVGILNLCEVLLEFPPQFQYAHIPFPDGYPIPKECFDRCMDWLENHHNQLSQTVLVHCAIGCSRSPTICAAYLYKKWLFQDMDQALMHIKDCRL